MRVNEVVAGVAQRHPAATSLIDDAGPMTYLELANDSASLTEELHARLEPSTAALLLLRNSRHLAIWQLACASAGILPVLCDPAGLGRDLAATTAAFRPSIVVADIDDKRVSGIGRPAEIRGCDGVACRHLSNGLSFDREEWDDPYCVICTSGSSGAAKGVVLSHGAWLESATRLSRALDLRPGEVALHAASLAHGSGLLALAVWMTGGTNVLVDGFQPADFIARAREVRATVTFLVPTMLFDLMQEPGFSPNVLPDLRTINYSGGPAPASLVLKAARRWGDRLVQDYGLIEAPAPQLVLSRQEHARLASYPEPALARSCGRPWAATELTVVRAGGTSAAGEDVSEIVIRGPTLMTGYLTAAGLDRSPVRDGELRTQDLARQARDGTVTLLGRSSRLVISGGRKISPERVEAELADALGLGQIAVVGIPDQRWGEMLIALVTATGSQEPEPELRRLAEERLAPHERPKAYLRVDAIPTGPTGKRRVAELVALASAHLPARSEAR